MNIQLLLPIVIVVALNIANMLFIRYLNKRGLADHISCRKLLHILSACGAIFASLILTQYSYIFVCLLFAIIYSVLHARDQLKFINDETFRSIGAPLFPISLAFMAFFLWNIPIIHIIGILILGIPDSIGAFEELSAIEQTAYQAKRIKLLVYFCLCSALLFMVLPIPLALVTALGLTLVEHISKHGSDNLTVPITYTLIILSLNEVGSLPYG